jgi:hypothetical protein
MAERAFAITLGVVVAFGALFIALSMDTIAIHGKPLLFGFDHGAIQLTSLLALLIFAVACSRASLAAIALMAATPAAIFAAAQVRFALMDLVGTVVLGAVIARARRVRFVAIAAILIVAAMAGLASRASMSLAYFVHARASIANLVSGIESKLDIHIEPAAPPDQSFAAGPPGCPDLNVNNSIDMRKQLYAEALLLVPSAGLTGIGLEKFVDLSCLRMEAHNTLLQTAIELGWLPAALLAALMIVVALLLWPLARTRRDALLALLALAYAVAMSFVSGRITEDIFLFLMIGYGAGTAATVR